MHLADPKSDRGADAPAVLARLDADAEQGLSDAEAARRLAEHGPNELEDRSVESPWKILWRQLNATMVRILVLAGILSAGLGDYRDAIAIFAIVILNALLGFTQEYRAEKAMAALKRLAVPAVRVRRNGHVREIPARELVPGDIVLLEAGNLVPADGRLLEGFNLRIQESVLTGESEPVEKDPDEPYIAGAPLGDRRSTAYMGTVVTYGRGQAVVTETGMRTELGRIAGMIRAAGQQQSPLQRRLDELGRGLAFLALAFVAVIFVAGLLRGEGLRLMFLTAVSTAVAAVPEGLPAVVTIALALGGQRMLKRGALIRKLTAVETLGSVTVICSDKTGTITENRMTAVAIEVAGHHVDLTAEPVTDQPAAMRLALAGGALCNDALLEPRTEREPGGGAPARPQVVGDPTEGALLLAAAQAGLEKKALERNYPRVAELPFDSQRKRMTTVHRPASPRAQSILPLEMLRKAAPEGSETGIAFTKGAVDGLLAVSTRVWVDERPEPLDAAWRERISAAHDRLARDGMRVLGVACRILEWPLEKRDAEALEQDLTFVGMVGMIDPARPEAKAAARTCEKAGIRPIMITGDHPLTARNIARELGAFEGGRLLTGQELSQLSDDELQTVVDEVSVYARVSPEHKLNIVQALQGRGHIVAMTGDGVNDAPALKRADVGVAMGLSGTDVSREAADIVLLDDNFSTIVAAVEEGRVIYDNIRKFIRYLLTSNSSEILVILTAPFLGMPLPLLPLQILWMNLVTDGLPALALGVQPAERNVMDRPPRPPADKILDRRMLRSITSLGLLTTVASLAGGYWYWHKGDTHWQTMIFTILIFSQVSLAIGMQSERDSLWRVGVLANKALLGALALTVALQVAVVYIPFWQGIFETVTLPPRDLLACVALSLVPLGGVEVEKWFVRRSEV